MWQKSMIYKIIFLSFFIVYHCSGMLEQSVCFYKPFIYVGDQEHQNKRENVFSFFGKATQDSNMHIIKELQSYEKEGVCFDWALNQFIPGIKELGIPFSYAYDWAAYIVNTYCEQTQSPGKSNLAVYVADQNDRSIEHYGIVADQLRIDSKWATDPYIRNHALFDIHVDWGKTVYFFVLKKEFQNNISKLLNLLQEKIFLCDNTLSNIMMLHKHQEYLLFALAQGEKAENICDYEERFDHPQNQMYQCMTRKNKNTSYNKIIHQLILRIPIFFLDCCNDKKETPLMLASQRGDIECVNILLTYGAKVNVQDAVGETAFDKAWKKGHGELLALLLKHGAISKQNSFTCKTIIMLCLTKKLLREAIFCAVPPAMFGTLYFRYAGLPWPIAIFYPMMGSSLGVFFGVLFNSPLKPIFEQLLQNVFS